MKSPLETLIAAVHGYEERGHHGSCFYNHCKRMDRPVTEAECTCGLHTLKNAVKAVEGSSDVAFSVERAHQFELGYDADHDDHHKAGELALAAALLAAPYPLLRKDEFANGTSFVDPWPWSAPSGRPFHGNVLLPNSTMPTEARIRQLEKAGAFLLAEIDRLKRLKAGEGR